jgi:hypothetical protein
MKLSFLLCSLVLSVPAWCSSVNAIPVNSNPGELQYQAIGSVWPQNGLKKPLRERKFFYKGRGTMGLLLGIVLGPVGYAGVHIFSHNKTMREKANTGFAIWIGAAIVGLLIWQGIESKVTLDDVLGYTLEVIIQGLGN